MQPEDSLMVQVFGGYNRDERFFSLIGRNTSPLCICIKADSLEEKAVVGGAIKTIGFFY